MIPESRRQLPILTGFLSLVSVVTVLTVAFGPIVAEPKAGAGRLPPSEFAAGTGSPAAVAGASGDGAAIADRVGPSVAFITTPSGVGSGVLIAEGLVVTNAHVVWPFDTVGLRFPGGPRLDATVLGVDARSDTALLQVRGRLPAPAEIGVPGEIDRSATLYAVGYAGAIELAPDPTVASGAYRGSFEWEFSGVTWLAAETAAISGQSGGALVDDRGKLLGITTFGSAAEVFAISVDDVLAIAENLSLRRGDVEDRRPKRAIGTGAHELSLTAPWEQATFLVWLPAASRAHVEADGDVEWRALDPFGIELAAGTGMIDVVWPNASPGIIHATARRKMAGSVESSVPLVRHTEPDDGARIEMGGGYSGFVDLPGDQDWLVVDIHDAADLTVEVEAQTRLRVALYDFESMTKLGEIVNERGFFFDEPPLVVSQLAPGRYVVVVEDVGAQFGTYRIDIS
jgi:S1-C subfamily serine protease